jgi:hypothetical protein
MATASFRVTLAAALTLSVAGGCVGTPNPGRLPQMPPHRAWALVFDQENLAALGPADDVLHDRLPYQAWAFDGAAGETVALDVHGCAMRPLLVLLDASGRELARNQDTRSARIAQTLPTAQRYYVVVTRTIPSSRAVITPYQLYAARSGTATPPPAGLPAAPSLPPPGTQTRSLIVTDFQDVGRGPGLPPVRRVFGVDEAPVFYLTGLRGGLRLFDLRTGDEVPFAVFPGPRRLQPHTYGYYLSAPLPPGEYCVEDPPAMPEVAAIFRVGDAVQPPEHDSTLTAIYATVVAADGNAQAPALTRFAPEEPILLLARLGAGRQHAVATVSVAATAARRTVYHAAPSPLQPGHPGFYRAGTLPPGRYVARLAIADTVVASWAFRVDGP